MDSTRYGFSGEARGNGIVARVTAVHRERYEIICEKGAGYARLKATSYYADGETFPTTGDFVMLDWQEAGDSRVTATLKRKTAFLRSDPTTGRQTEQAAAANFDWVFLLQSLNHDFNARRLERYLTLAWQSGAEPVVILTKADVGEDVERKRIAAEGVSGGARVHVVSARTGEGLETLKPYLEPGRTLVFLGSSGVGKSSLVNALAGEEIMSTGEIREDDSRGRHTTTHRQLVFLPCGAMIIDTPGMRELGMWDVTEGLGKSFADVEELMGRCRFSNCAHKTEPGCAVLAAIAAGEITQERFDSYLRLKKEAKFADDKGGYLRDRQARHKRMAIEARASRPPCANNGKKTQR